MLKYSSKWEERLLICIVIVLAWSVHMSHAVAANSASGTVNFKATLLADCFISVSQARIDFGNVNASKLGSKAAGTEITGH